MTLSGIEETKTDSEVLNKHILRATEGSMFSAYKKYSSHKSQLIEKGYMTNAA